MTTPNATNANSNIFAKHNPTHTPRSVPSPIVARSSASKAASSTTAQSQHALSSKPAMGGTAMTASLSQMSNASTGSAQGLGVIANNLLGASPSANLLAFASPAGGLGSLDMATPSLLDAAAAASQPMNLSLSDLGIPSGKRNEDEERRLKLDAVLAKLLGPSDARRFGRVSEEGVRRVGRWAGLDVEVEAKWEARQFEGNRPVAVAGKNNVLIDFTFKDNLPTHIDVSFFSEEKSVAAHQSAAASVLLADLTPPPTVSAINANLDRFAANLETLATLDKLSVAGQLNCFEAIGGVYESLRKLYEHEKKAAQAIVQAKRGNTDLRAERHAMCKNSGRPQMHARKNIGLSLDYWMEGSNIYPSTPARPNDDSAMDVDSKPTPSEEDVRGTVFALDITAEASSPDLYPSLRVSSSWIADRILKPTEETTDPADLLSGTQSIDWQDPPPTYISNSSDQGGDAMAIDSNPDPSSQKLPAARFVARLNPPLAMPWTAATSILQSVGAGNIITDIPNIQQTYEMSLLQKHTTAHDVTLHQKPQPTTSSASVQSTTSVLLPDGGRAKHKNALFPKQDFGYVLKEIPFAHPRQVIALLPVLRQWACLGSMLRSTFAIPFVPSTEQDKNDTLSLTDLLNSTNLVNDAVAIDITLSTSPSPGLDFVFPVTGVEGGLASISTGVLANGQIVVMAQNLVGGGEEEQSNAARKIARALELVGDIGVWVEWVRKTYAA